MTKWKHILFDWGDTLMRDDRSRDDAMCAWPQVEAIEGAERTLRVLSQACMISVATGAGRSDEQMVRQALRRVGLDQHIAHVFVAGRLGFEKSDPRFWVHIQQALHAGPDEILVVGDSFSSDVRAPVQAGLRAAWFNPNSCEKREGSRHMTFHALTELIDPCAWFNR